MRAILARLTGRAGWYARRWCTGTYGQPSCRGLGRQPSQLDRESGLGNGSEGDSEGALGAVVEIVSTLAASMRYFCVSRGCLEEGQHGEQFSRALLACVQRTSLWKRALALRKFFSTLLKTPFKAASKLGNNYTEPKTAIHTCSQLSKTPFKTASKLGNKYTEPTESTTIIFYSSNTNPN